MIRSLREIKRSTIAVTAKECRRNGSADSIKLRARSFNSYHGQPFPYYGEPVDSFQADPSQRYYGNQNGYQLNPNFAVFHRGENWGFSRFGHQFGGQYSPYPVGGSWRSFGPVCHCRFCGCPQYLPPVYVGDWDWNPNFGTYSGGGVQGNGFDGRGFGYDQGDWSRMRGHYDRTNAGGGGFDGGDGRNLGYENFYRPCAENSSKLSRNPNEDWGTYPNATPNVGIRRQDLGDSYNGRRGVNHVNEHMEHKVSHDGYKWKNHGFTENGGRDGRGQVAWSDPGNYYTHHGTEHSVHSESSRLHRGPECADQKNVNGNGYNRGSNGGQPLNPTANGRPVNSYGYVGEDKQNRQSPRISDLLRKDDKHGSYERNWSSYNDKLRGFQQNSKVSRGNNLNGGQYQERFNVFNNSSRTMYEETQDGHNLRNLYDPLPKFAANEQPMNPNRSNAQNNPMPNINYTKYDGGRIPHTMVHDVKEQPTRMTDRSGQLHQIPQTCRKASNEVAGQRHFGIENTDSSEQHQPQVKISRQTQKMDRNQHQAQHRNSESDYHGDTKPTPSPTLNAYHSVGGSQDLNCESPGEDIKPEPIRGTVEELLSFIEDGKLTLAVKVLDVMEKKKERLDPEKDLFKVKMLIQACGDSKAVAEAKAVHKHIVNLMHPPKFSIYNKILGMYLNCGAITDAFSMFHNMAAHNLTSWDTLIKGLVKNNLGEEALDVFAEFKNTESEPDGPMFLGVFAACRLVGDVTEGMLHFESMSKHYGITPSMKHYISVVELMGHAGYLDEAMEFIESMEVEPSVDVWETMMNVCRIQGNTELADRCAEVVQVLDPTRLSEESKAGLIPSKASNLKIDENEREVDLTPSKTTDPVTDVKTSTPGLLIPLKNNSDAQNDVEDCGNIMFA